MLNAFSLQMDRGKLYQQDQRITPPSTPESFHTTLKSRENGFLVSSDLSHPALTKSHMLNHNSTKELIHGDTYKNSQTVPSARLTSNGDCVHGRTQPFKEQSKSQVVEAVPQRTGSYKDAIGNHMRMRYVDASDSSSDERRMISPKEDQKLKPSSASRPLSFMKALEASEEIEGDVSKQQALMPTIKGYYTPQNSYDIAYEISV